MAILLKTPLTSPLEKLHRRKNGALVASVVAAYAPTRAIPQRAFHPRYEPATAARLRAGLQPALIMSPGSIEGRPIRG
jgi:hypothetical protein